MVKLVLTALAAAGIGGAVALKVALQAINGIQTKDKVAKADGYRLMNATARPGQTVFAGDSITEGYRLDEWFAGYTQSTGHSVYNRGISAETSAELLARWDDTVLALAPSRIVLLIGTNDLAQGVTPEAAAANVREMLARTTAKVPQCRVVVQAVYPVDTGVGGPLVRRALTGKKTPEAIRRLNQLLAEAAAGAGATWLDLTGDLADATGRLDPAYSNDGLHPNAAGYARLTPRIEAALTA